MMKNLLVAAAAIGVAVVAIAGGANSGLKAGESVMPFHPKHITGPLANSEKCFPCTFQNRPQVQVWVTGDNVKNITEIAKALEGRMVANEKSEFKALIVLVSNGSNDAELAKIAKTVSADNKLTRVAMAVISPKDNAVGAYKINTGSEVKNTVLVYRDWKVRTNLVNVKGDKAGLATLNAAIDGVIK